MHEHVLEQVNGRLTVVEKDKAFFVTREEDLSDWLVRFEKSPDFKAREWAENMVHVYNRRLSRLSAGASGRAASQLRSESVDLAT